MIPSGMGKFQYQHHPMRPWTAGMGPPWDPATEAMVGHTVVLFFEAVDALVFTEQKAHCRLINQHLYVPTFRWVIVDYTYYYNKVTRTCMTEIFPERTI